MSKLYSVLLDEEKIKVLVVAASKKTKNKNILLLKYCKKL